MNEIEPYSLWLGRQIARLEAQVALYRRIETGCAGQASRIEILETVIAGMRSRMPPAAARADPSCRASTRITPWQGGWGAADMMPPLAAWLPLEADRLTALASELRSRDEWLETADRLETRAALYRRAAAYPCPVEVIKAAELAPMPAVEQRSRLREIVAAAAAAPIEFGPMPAPFTAGEQLGLFA